MTTWNRQTHVRRRIFFYRMRLTDTSETPNEEHQASEVFREFQHLLWDEEAGKQSRYLFHPADSANVMVNVDIDSDGLIKAQFGRTNRNQLPSIESKGNVGPLKLKDYEGLFTVSHLVIFPNGVVVQEGVKSGPTIPGLKRYIKDRCGGLIDKVEINPIPAVGFVKLIPKITQIRSLNLALARKKESAFQDIDDSIYGIFKELSAWADFDQYSLTGRMKKEKRRGPVLTRFLTKLAPKIKSKELKQQLDRLKLGVFLDESTKLVFIDLLDAHLTAEVIVERMHNRSRNAKSEDILNRLESIYESYKDEIEKGWEMITDEYSGPVQETLSDN